MRITPQAASSQSAGDAPLLNRLWWLPLVFVVASLCVLAVVPIVVEQKVRSVRNGVVTASDRARVLVNDLEAALATEMLQPDSTEGSPQATIRAEMEQVKADADSLAVTVRSVDQQAAEQYEHLRAQLAQWRAPAPGGPPSVQAVGRAHAVLAAADTLDLHLMHVSDAARASVRTLERLGVMLALVFVPLALIAVGVVVWGGQRVLHFARVAERERAEVVRSTEARAALLRGVTHDVKNPLGAASGYAHLLADGVAGHLSEPQLEMVRRIRRLVDTSVQTVSDLLEFARVDGTPMRVHRVAADLGTITHEVVEDHLGLLREAGLTLSSTLSPTAVLTDPLRVRQVLTNLLSNAIKYTPRGGTISVHTVEERRGSAWYAGIEVRDTGPGVPPELRERIFDEFVRADPVSVAGSGVGLAISRRLARMLGGDVTFAPNRPSGAVFTLWLEASAPSDSKAAALAATRDHT